MKEKGKSALKIESKLQVVGTEGSIPVRLLSGICQSGDPSERSLSGSHQLTAQQIPLLGCLVASGSSGLINTVH